MLAFPYSIPRTPKRFLMAFIDSAPNKLPTLQLFGLHFLNYGLAIWSFLGPIFMEPTP